MWLMPSVLTSLPAVTNAMDEREEKRQEWPVWVNWERKIISFQEAAGFEKLVYPTHDEMFRFAIDKSMSGFSIQ